jgi:outer membrane protein TolC
MKKSKLYAFLLLFLLAPWWPSWAQPTSDRKTHRLTAQQCVDYARQNNVEVRKALENIAIQSEVNREITSNALPQLNGSFSYTNYLKIPTSLVPGEFFGQPGKFVPVQFGVKHNVSTGLDLNQILFDGQVFVGLQARDAAMKLSEKASEFTQQNISVNVLKIYYQLSVADYQLELIDSNIARFDKLLFETNQIYKNGFAEKLDVDKVKVTLTNLKTDKLKVAAGIENGYLGLKLLMGMPMQDSLILTEKLTEEILKSDILDTGFHYSDRRDYQLLQLNKQLNEYNVRRYKLSYIPTISAFANLSTQAQRPEFDFFNGGQWFPISFFGFRINAPIFDGFYRSSKIRQAKSDVKKIDYDLGNLENSINRDIANAKVRLQAALLAADAQKDNLGLSEKVLMQTQKKYQQGLGSNTEINNAQTEFKAAQTNFFNALYDAISAKVDYLNALGKIQ